MKNTFERLSLLTRWGLLAVLVWAMARSGAVCAVVAEPIPDEYRIGGWAIGCQAYSFNRFTVCEAIEKTAQAGGKIIEFYPGQKIGGGATEGATLTPDTADDAIAVVRAQLQKFHVRAVSFGVTGLNKDDATNRKTFEFARKMGIRTIVSEPDPAALDQIEKLVREFDIRVAIHNHPRRANDASYRFWNPVYVAALVKNRDTRIGSCADTGHWVRSGIKPTDALKTLRGRILDVHLKDLDAFAPGAHDVPHGTGVSDIAGVLRELKSQKYDGALAIEYEYNWDASVPEIAQSIGYVRGLYYVPSR